MFLNLRETAYLDPLHFWQFDEFFYVIFCCFCTIIGTMLRQYMEFLAIHQYVFFYFWVFFFTFGTQSTCSKQ